MHIRRYKAGYSRRHFLEQMGRGVLATGVLAPLWPTIAATGSVERAYPEELLSISAYTGGKISDGDRIDANNVELVKDARPHSVYADFRNGPGTNGPVHHNRYYEAQPLGIY